MESNSLFSTSVAVDENCAKEPKVEYDFEMNPWSVEDASAFLKYCCPECDYQILDFEMFSWHALQNHAKSKVLFEVEKYDEKVRNYGENETIVCFEEFYLINLEALNIIIIFISKFYSYFQSQLKTIAISR